jgi:hypothetical protein
MPGKDFLQKVPPRTPPQKLLSCSTSAAFGRGRIIYLWVFAFLQVLLKRTGNIIDVSRAL